MKQESTGKSSFTPYVSPLATPTEVSLKAILFGIFFGVLFGAANAYLGLMAGLTISTSIPVAVLTVAAFRGLNSLGVENSILEANLSQTVGSASSSVASGVIFTIPALFLWGMPPSFLQMTLLAMSGGLLGVLFMIPLRPLLIVREHGNLPYPEGTACAEVLLATEKGGGRAKNVFLGLLAGAILKLLTTGIHAFKSKVSFAIPLLPKGEIGTKISAALLGVGYILGLRVSAIMVGGGLLSSLIIIPGIAIWGASQSTPFYPETELLIPAMDPHLIWTRYVRYIGAGAVATAGIITLIKSIPTMVESFQVGIAEMRKRIGGEKLVVPRTERDLSLGVVGGGIIVLFLLLSLVPQIFGVLPGIGARMIAAILVVVCAFFFVTVASRIVGLVGVTSNPTSGMTIGTLLLTSSIFLALGWTGAKGQVAALTIGCVVAIAASIAGDTSQDLKTGYILGATPYRQQLGELVGVLTSAAFVCATIIFLNDAYGFGGIDLPAPQATLMKVVIEGVLQQNLPWLLVGLGAVIAIVCELFKIPSLPFAVGVYLPVSTMVPVFLGGLLRWRIEKGASDENRQLRRDRGILFGSGLVGGEGLIGVFIAGMVGYESYKKVTFPRFEADLLGSAAPYAALAIFILLIGYFRHLCRSDS